MNEELLKRILKSYYRELEDYKKVKDAFKISGWWNWAEQVKFEDNADIQDIKKILDNFGSHPISRGISVVNATPVTFLEDGKKWERVVPYPPIILNYPKEFGLQGVEFDGIFSIPIAPRMSYYAHRLNTIANGAVLEVGGGLGAVALHLFRDIKFKNTYLNFELPHVGLITKYFLMSLFPNKKFLLYGEDDLKNFKKYDIVLMPHFAIKKMPPKSCSVIFNAHSLSEMGTSQIKEFYKQFDRIGKDYMLHFNHDSQVISENGYPMVDIDSKNPVWLSGLAPKKWKQLTMTLEPFSGSEILPIDYLEFLYKI